MPVKNTRHKKISKATKAPVTEADEIVPVIPIKGKLPIVELDDHEGVALDEKPEDDPLATNEETEDAASEEADLEEEIDPFGDKWEV